MAPATSFLPTIPAFALCRQVHRGDQKMSNYQAAITADYKTREPVYVSIVVGTIRGMEAASSPRVSCAAWRNLRRS